MAKAKVIGLELLGMGNQTHKSGDIVTEDHFHPGHFEQLIKNGWLELQPEEQEKEAEKITLTDEDLANNLDLAENGLKAGDVITLPEGFKKVEAKTGKGKKAEKPAETKTGSES